jgi:hypothetical protein
MAEIELPNPEELKELMNDRFSKRVALMTAVFAVVLAITSLGGSNAMKELLLTQQQSSDQWAFYQSKVLREHLYKLEALKTGMALAERGPTMTGAARQMYEQNAHTFADEEKRYASEKKEIEQSAKKLEAQRDIAQARDPYFDYAEVLLQIAIVLASIAILSGSRPVLWISVGCAGIGSVLSLNGYLLLFRIPFFH